MQKQRCGLRSSSSRAGEKAPRTCGKSEEEESGQRRKRNCIYGAPTTYQATGSRVHGYIPRICRHCPRFPDQDMDAEGVTEITQTTLNSQEATGTLRVCTDWPPRLSVHSEDQRLLFP